MDVAVYKRHRAACKHRANRIYKACGCRIMLEGTATTDVDVQAVRSVFPGFARMGRFRLSAETRNWEDAQKKARTIERRALDIVAGVVPAAEAVTVAQAVQTFMAAKRNDGLEEPTLQKLAKTTERIKEFCEAAGLGNIADVRFDHLSTWDWSRFFGTTHSLITNQERVKSFFRFFHNAGVIHRNPAASWKRVTGKTAQVSGFTAEEYERILKAVGKCGFSAETERKVYSLVQLMRHAGLAIIDAACLERNQIVERNGEYRVSLATRQKTSKHGRLQRIDNAIPAAVGRDLMAVLNGNPRYVFWNRAGEDAATEVEKRDAVKYWQKRVRTLLDKAGFPDATGHKFRHTLAIEMIRHGATFEDVAAALGNTVAVVAKFYSHEWEQVRSGKTDAALKATWR